MIHANRIVTVGEQESIIDRPIILYRGDREVEIEFTLVGNEFTFSEEGNVIKSVNASHGQLVLNTPSGEHMFSELAECHEGKVVFVVTKEMIDEFIEMGFYSFQIRLYDSAEMKSRVTIPPVMNGFDIRNPIAAEDEANVVDQGLVDYARIFKDQSNEELHTFDWDGVYNKTEWVHHDVITENKMNKIEDALYSINANIKESDVFMLNALDNVKKDADKYVKEHMAEVEADIEVFERELNTGVEKFKVDTNASVEQFKIDTNAAMTAHKNEVSEELAIIDSKYNNLDFVNVKDFGAIGDGVNDDTEAIQEAINTGKNVLIPEGVFLISRNLTISDVSWKRVIKGVGDEYTPSTTIITNTYPAITCLAGGVTIEKLQLKTESPILEGDYWFIDAYKTKMDNPDIDLTIRNCNFEGLPYAIRIKGRNIVIEDNLFFGITNAVLKIDFTENIDNPMPDNPYVYNNLQSGMRGYILKNNRCHYIRSYLIENVGFNAENITGIQILDNFMEGTLFVKGYLKDALIAGNNAFQVSTSKPMFDCISIKNVVINGNIMKGEYTFDGLYESSMENIIVCPDVENLIFTNNYISNVRTNVFWFSGVSNRIIFENNISRRISTVNGAYVTFTGTEHNDIKIHDKIESPNRSTWVAIAKGASTVVTNYNINTSITGGEYERLHGLDPSYSSETSISNKMSGYYTGAYTGDITIVTKYKPSIFEISNDAGECYIFNCKKDTIFVYNGVRLQGDKFNISGKTYSWIAY